ncbi:MAG: hypothetical protein Q9184_003750 [Pyrenodesmia sp. 2 TL-2023]
MASTKDITLLEREKKAWAHAAHELAQRCDEFGTKLASWEAAVKANRIAVNESAGAILESREHLADLKAELNMLRERRMSLIAALPTAVTVVIVNATDRTATTSPIFSQSKPGLSLSPNLKDTWNKISFDADITLDDEWVLMELMQGTANNHMDGHTEGQKETKHGRRPICSIGIPRQYRSRRNRA